MFIKKFNLKATSFVVSLFAILTSSQTFADHTCFHRSHHRPLAGVEAAQANYEDSSPIIPVLNEPISFSIKNLRKNIKVNSDRTVFKVQVPGLYSIDSFLLLSVPNIGDSAAGYITINGRTLLTFFTRGTSTTAPIVDFHFFDRLAYLKKGDKVSVVLTEFVPGTTILACGFVMVALNNSR